METWEGLRGRELGQHPVTLSKFLQINVAIFATAMTLGMAGALQPSPLKNWCFQEINSGKKLPAFFLAPFNSQVFHE